MCSKQALKGSDMERTSYNLSNGNRFRIRENEILILARREKTPLQQLIIHAPKI